MRTKSTLEYVEEVLSPDECPVVEGDDILGVQVLSVEPVGETMLRWRYVVKHVQRVGPGLDRDDDAYIREGAY